MTYVNFRLLVAGIGHGWFRNVDRANRTVTLYGFYSFTHHGWNRVLTVMSPEGAAAAARRIAAGEGVEAHTNEGHLPRYVEKRRGALALLVEDNGIVVLSKAEWDARKRDLGDRIW